MGRALIAAARRAASLARTPRTQRGKGAYGRPPAKPFSWCAAAKTLHMPRAPHRAQPLEERTLTTTKEDECLSLINEIKRHYK